jgi:precorrin-3B synthase
MTQAYVRGACPGLSAPMETGDGLLVRFLPAAPIQLDAFIALCQAPRAHGNGIIEITARGSVQARGLTADSAPLFAAEVAALGIDICDGVPVIADPLPGDPALIDANALANALRRTIAETAFDLAPKVSVIVDGGGRLDLDRLSADIRLHAVATAQGPRFQLAIAGDARSAAQLGTIAPGEAIDAVLGLLAQIAALGPDARGADLLDAPAFALPDEDLPARSSRADAIGLHPIEDGTWVLGIGLAFGHVEAEPLSELASIAKAHGADWARPVPRRALLFGPLNQANAVALKEAALGFGFVTRTEDPRRRIAACAGAPLCRHGLIAARELAAELAGDVPLPAGDGIALHMSGCAKGCAHPSRAPLTVVGTEKGCAIVRDGTARARPIKHVAARELAAALIGKREVAHA